MLVAGCWITRYVAIALVWRSNTKACRFTLEVIRQSVFSILIDYTIKIRGMRGGITQGSIIRWG